MYASALRKCYYKKLFLAVNCCKGCLRALASSLPMTVECGRLCDADSLAVRELR